MKKFLLLSIFVLCLNVSAYDTGGRFGMGVRFWGTPLITFADVKVDVSNVIEFEPSIGYYNIDYGEGAGYDHLLITSLLMNIKPVRAERANLLFKLGGLFSNNYYTTFAILLGLGIEHFVNDNFSINAGILSGFAHTSSDGYSASLTTVGTQIADFSLVWYLK